VVTVRVSVVVMVSLCVYIMILFCIGITLFPVFYAFRIYAIYNRALYADSGGRIAYHSIDLRRRP